MHSLRDVVERILKEYLQVDYQPGDKGPTVRCPWHDDKTPSAQIFIDEKTAKFCCYACIDRKNIDFETYIGRIKKIDVLAARREIERLYGYETSGILDVDIIEKYHTAVWTSTEALDQLERRAVTKDIIRKYRIGYNAGRITIPVPNRFGLYVNVRRYLPGAPGKLKMKNQKGCGKKPRLYPFSQLDYDTIVLCGGELKALVAAEELNQHGIGAISTTVGETDWYSEFNEYFRDKRVYVCYDIDTAGQKAAEKICNTLSTVASWVGNIVLPLDIDDYPTGDINDYVAAIGGKLHPLVEATQRWIPSFNKTERDNEIYKVSISDSVHARYSGKRVAVKACVSAIHESPFAVPRTVSVVCDRDQNCCGACEISFEQGNPIRELSSESIEMLELIDTPRDKHANCLKTALNIPRRCRSVQFEPLEFYHAEECRVSPQLSLDGDTQQREMLPAIFIGDDVVLNETYDAEARVYPHPKTQASTILVSNFTATEDALTKYKCPRPQELEIFRPKSWEPDDIERKLHDIYTDLEANVTNIWYRRDIHFVVDLVYHSLLNVNIRGKTEKGWVEALIIGDSAQGKTETVANLMKHYRLGEKVDCKNATIAGLIGGLEQIGKRWYVRWGAIPTNDMRLVHMEELKGISTEHIGKMTDMRSTGIAQLEKIENRRRHARTRIVATSNARDGRCLEDRGKGCHAIVDLVGALEDIRRFDLCLGVSERDVDQDLINACQLTQPHHEHIYTSSLCHELVLFAWTCKNLHVQNDTHLIQTGLDLAHDMAYPQIPLVDAGSIRWKLLRLSAALATRLFSTNEVYDTVIVRPCHVEYIASFLRRIYSSSALDYARLAKQNVAGRIREKDKVLTWIHNLPFPEDFRRLLLENDSGYTIEDLMDWSSWTQEEARDASSFMIRHGCAVKRGRKYMASSGFIDELKAIKKFDTTEYPKDDTEF